MERGGFNMENTQPKKLGGALLAVTIINIIIFVFELIGSITLLLAKNSNNELIKSNKAIADANPTEYKILLVLSIIAIIGLILILFKQVIGVYTYFASAIISIIYTIVSSGFGSTIFSLILFILMAIFIYLKKDVFWDSNNNITK